MAHHLKLNHTFATQPSSPTPWELKACSRRDLCTDVRNNLFVRAKLLWMTPSASADDRMNRLQHIRTMGKLVTHNTAALRILMLRTEAYKRLHRVWFSLYLARKVRILGAESRSEVVWKWEEWMTAEGHRELLEVMEIFCILITVVAM